MDAILFWENKQIQTLKNVTITARTPLTTIEVAGCHGEEAGCRDSSEQLCSADHESILRTNQIQGLIYSL